MRETIGIDETGLKFSFSDDWPKSKDAPVMGRRWTGMTHFRTVVFDDDRYGGDQRRQRDKVSLAGLEDDSCLRPCLAFCLEPYGLSAPQYVTRDSCIFA